jgi:hypothetical protein
LAKGGYVGEIHFEKNESPMTGPGTARDENFTANRTPRGDT